jgi:predicted O-linked N-acetylglucosamine transferase (SPINDLY family)
VNGDDAAFEQAQALANRGDPVGAIRQLERHLQRQPRHVPGRMLMAQLLVATGRQELAVEAARVVVTLAPGAAMAHYTLGRALKSTGDLTGAVEAYLRALSLDAGNADFRTSLGIALRASGRVEAAIEQYRIVLRLQPGHLEATRNLSNALQAMGRGEEARVFGVIANPELTREFNRHLREGLELLNRDEPGPALGELMDAHRMDPQSALVHVGLASVYAKLHEPNLAVTHADRAAQLDPSLDDAIRLCCEFSITYGLADRAPGYFERARLLNDVPERRVAATMIVPAISASVAEIESTRTRVEGALDELLLDPPRIERPELTEPASSFFLAYHGENNRRLLMKRGSLYLAANPALGWMAPHCREPRECRGRIKVGLISRFLGDHSIGKTTQGFVYELPRDRFEVFVLRIPPFQSDALAAQIDARADRVVRLARDLAQNRELIAGLELDVLFYQDIGMEAYSLLLAFARLAPVQCVSFGHPDTTGIPAMDYFVSNDAFEPEGAEEHYSEQLFLLRDLPTLAYYLRPKRPARLAARHSFGLPEDATLYVCPQTLFKLHPEFDAVLASILRRDPKGLVVLIKGYLDLWTEKLRQRFHLAMPDVASRVVFLTHMPGEVFLGLLASADVILDTPHFNGMNSSLEAFAMDKPIVTMPTGLQRGRHTAAMYRKMGVLDCIAKSPEHYVDLAVRLGTDREFRRHASERISLHSHVLYEDRRVISEFERFFIAARGLAAGQA